MLNSLPEPLTLNSYQRQFMDASEQFVGYFGGVGNGKTFIACMKIIETSTQNPKNLCLVGRLTYPELRDSTKEVFMSVLNLLYPPEAFTHNKAENSITFWNGSTVIFRHLDNQAALLGPNLGSFYIDQAEEVDEEVFLTLQSRLRRSGVKKHKGIITGNPRGFNWVYYRFGLDDSQGEKNYSKDFYHRMITAPTIANLKNLPANYIDSLKQSYSKEWFDRYVMGSWEAFEGQIFDLTKITGYDELPEIKMILTACDPAISKRKEACNTAFCTLGVGADNHIYDLETIAGQWSFLETLEEARKLISRQKINYLGVEDVAYQRALTEACVKYFPDINVVDMKADKDKFRRAKSVSHIVSKGLFHTNNKQLMAELTAFDPEAEGKERKDRVDAMVHALHMVQQFASIEYIKEVNKFEGMTSHQAFMVQVEESERALMEQENPYIGFMNQEIKVEEYSPTTTIPDPNYY